MAGKSKNDPAAVERYLAGRPEAERRALESLRRLIKRAAPGIDERISYGTAVMFSRGYDVVGFVAQKQHLSFFTASPGLARAMKNEITRTRELSGATIHFSPDHPLPPALVTKIVKARLAENESRKR